MQGVGEVSSAADAPVPIEGFDEAHQAVRGDSSIQFELPVAPTSSLPQSPREQTPAPQRPAPTPPRPRAEVQSPPAIPAPASDGAGLLPLFWVFVALAAVGLIYLIVARIAGWERREKPVAADSAEPAWQRPSEIVARGLLDDADSLAAAGRFSEAAHLLLHRSIDQIDDKRPATIRKAFTSRDIAALPAIPPAPASAFATIVRAVERSLFGGRTLDEAAWHDCRAAFERFAFAREWQ